MSGHYTSGFAYALPLHKPTFSKCAVIVPHVGHVNASVWVKTANHDSTGLLVNGTLPTPLFGDASIIIVLLHVPCVNY